ncbi:hypothetical protein M885DRAFT_507245 [Pelagophyceae sp. CCMP2097]|nr:hypothetical protein M885DRAFT_507245 [Pelagophyceae sp. CCMP2097]
MGVLRVAVLLALRAGRLALAEEVELTAAGAAGAPVAAVAEAAAPAPRSVALQLSTGGAARTVSVDVLPEDDCVSAALRFVLLQGVSHDANLMNSVIGAVFDAGVTETPPALTARTAGAYSKRAAEAAADERYLDAAADYVRASRRKGVEQEKVLAFLKDAAAALSDEVSHRKVLEEEAKVRALYEAREAREAAASAAARRRALDAQEDLASMLRAEAAALEALSDAGAEGGLSFSLTSEKGKAAARIAARPGEDPCDAVSRFCAAAPPAGAENYKCDARGFLGFAAKVQAGPAAGKANDDASARALEGQGDYVGAVAARARALILAATPEDEAPLAKALEEALEAARLARDVVGILAEALKASDFNGTASNEADVPDLEALHKRASKTLGQLVKGGAPTKWAVWLARTKASLGDWSGAESASAAALHWLATHDRAAMRQPWRRGEPKTLALALGAAAALERGRLDKAIKFVQTGLREDPDSPALVVQYEGLKALQRKTEAVDKLLKKGYSLKALDALDEAIGAVDALAAELGALGSTGNCDAYRATLLVRACSANSRVKRHEDALLACDRAVDILTKTQAPLFDALVARAAALERDDDFSAAIRDWRLAVESRGGSPESRQADPSQWEFLDDESVKHDARMRQRQASQLEMQFAKARDHAKVLELPANLASLSKERQCGWLKKQHKKLARQWHPDKARGSPSRAMRKMGLVTDAKEALMLQFGCKAPQQQQR